MKSIATYLAKLSAATVIIAGMTLLAPFIYAFVAWLMGLAFPNTFAALFELVGWKYSPFTTGLAVGIVRVVFLSFDLICFPFNFAAKD